MSADDAARPLPGDFRARVRRVLIEHGTLPAIVLRMVAHRLEATLRIGGRTATLDA